MLTKDLKPKGKDILLGIFETDTYFQLKCIGFIGYPIFSKWSKDHPILKKVEYACIHAHKIIFILDWVYFPINTKDSITCAELELICKNDEFFNKTIFVKGENVINFDKHLVIN
jgi:hypothetical protein